MKKALTIIFALALILCLAACGNEIPNEPHDTTAATTEPQPEPTIGEPTQPDVTVPNVTVPDVTDPPHTHNYTDTVSQAATCTSEGQRIYTCECGDSYTESIAKLGHSYTEKVTAPTCTKGGYTTHTCSRCADSYKNNEKAASGHSYSSKVTTNATCTNAGVKTFTCGKCSDKYTESIAKLGHSYTEKVTAPTCTKGGYTTHTCSRCADSYKDNEKAASGHSYSSKVTTNATCTKAGVKTFTCSKCSDKYTESIAKLGHSYTEKVTAPTCTKGGYTTHTCSRCADSYKDNEKAASGHSYSSKVTTNATCTKAGVKTFTCSKCSDKYTESIAKLAHNYTAATCTKAKTCTTCGATSGNALGHNTSSKVTTTATCSKAGTKTISCSRCSYKTTESIPATGHSYTAATCTKAKTCATCGATSGNALGHSYTYKTTKTPTTSATGTLTGTCSRCSSKPTVTLPKLNTTDYTRTQTKAPTCSAAGTYTWKWKTTTYGTISFTTSIAAKGHSWGDWVIITPSSPIAEGKQERTCSVCKQIGTGKIAKAVPYGSYFVDLDNYLPTDAERGHILIKPRVVWWQDGRLFAECFVINDTSQSVTADYVNHLTIYNPNTGLTLAEGYHFDLNNSTLKPGEYFIWTFVFSPDAVLYYGSSLSNLQAYM